MVRNFLYGALALMLGVVIYNSTEEALYSLRSPHLIYRAEGKLPVYKEQQDYSVNTYYPIVRLETKDGHFFCSGTVISDDYVLTAAHCLMKNSFIPKMNDEEIKVIGFKTNNDGRLPATDSGTGTTVKGQAAGLNNRADYALIKGDFKEFTKSRLLHHPNMFSFIVGPVVTCGYPWGAELTCYTTYGPPQTAYDSIAVGGRLYRLRICC